MVSLKVFNGFFFFVVCTYEYLPYPAGINIEYILHLDCRIYYLTIPYT